MGSIPIAFSFGLLRLPQLYVVALLTGVGTVFFDIAYQSYLPALIPRRRLVEGNARLGVSESIAQAAGPAIAGVLINLIGAARAVAVDAASFLVSALALLSIRAPEPAPHRVAGATPSFRRELGEGLSVVLGNPILRRIAGCTATSNLGSAVIFAVYLVFAYRRLHLSPGTVGLVFSAGAVAAIGGAAMAGRVARRIGVGPTIVWSIGIGGLGTMITPLTVVLPPALVVPALIIGSATFTVTGPIYNITQVSLRQAITPDRVQGRMNATMRTIVWGVFPIGSIAGGLLGNRAGLVPTLWVGAAISAAAFLWVVGPRIRGIATQPEPVAG